MSATVMSGMMRMSEAIRDQYHIWWDNEREEAYMKVTGVAAFAAEFIYTFADA